MALAGMTFTDWARAAGLFFAALAAVNALSLEAPTGAWRGIALAISEREQRALTSAALIRWLFAAAVVGFAGVSGAGRLLPCLCAIAVSLAALLCSLRFRLKLGKPKMRWSDLTGHPMLSRLMSRLLYALPIALAGYMAMPQLIIGYAIGLVLLAWMRLGVKKPETQAERRCTWLSTCAALCALLSVLLYPLNPALLRFTIVLPIYACGLGFVLDGQPHRILELLIPAVSGLSILLPTPYAALAACALFVLFVFFMRKALREAALPMRAFWIRRKARVR